MFIRPATPSDLPAIRSLEKATAGGVHWAIRDYEALFAPESPARVTLVAEDLQYNLTGFIIARCGPDEWEIENIIVAPEQRRRKLGSRLVRRILQAATNVRAAVLLEVRESNRPARQLYEQLGFMPIGRRALYYQDPPEDALILRFCGPNL